MMRRRKMAEKQDKRARVGTRTLRFELLEPRQLLATAATWVGPADVNQGDYLFRLASNWSNGAIPLNDDTAKYDVIFDKDVANPVELTPPLPPGGDFGRSDSLTIKAGNVKFVTSVGGTLGPQSYHLEKSARVGVVANQAASLTVEHATISSPVVQLGTVAQSSGTIRVSGGDTVLQPRDDLTVGEAGNGTLLGSGGARIWTLGTTTLGKEQGSYGLMVVDGKRSDGNSNFRAQPFQGRTSSLVIAGKGDGEFDISGGAFAEIRENLFIGQSGTGVVQVTGLSKLNVFGVAGTGRFTIGGGGAGTMVVGTASNVESDEVLDIGSINGKQGYLEIGAGSTVTGQAGATVGIRPNEDGKVTIVGDGKLELTRNGTLSIGTLGGTGLVEVGNADSRGYLALTAAGAVGPAPRNSIQIGSNAVAGATGTLSVGKLGRVDARTIDIEAGGTLVDDGITNAIKTENGGRIIAHTTGVAATTMQLNGDLVMDNAGTILENLGAVGAGNSDQLQVSGIATLRGNLQLSPLVDTTQYHAGDAFTVLHAGGGIAGSFSQVDTSSVPLTGGLSWEVDYSANDVSLRVVPSARPQISIGVSTPPASPIPASTDFLILDVSAPLTTSPIANVEFYRSSSSTVNSIQDATPLGPGTPVGTNGWTFEIDNPGSFLNSPMRYTFLAVATDIYGQISAPAYASIIPAAWSSPGDVWYESDDGSQDQSSNPYETPTTVLGGPEIATFSAVTQQSADSPFQESTTFSASGLTDQLDQGGSTIQSVSYYVDTSTISNDTNYYLGLLSRICG
jgi:T5SS/PEP-CTERM-associated repeat protein